VRKCALPASFAPASFDALFVDGLRQTRARYPNGDPLVPKSGYSAAGRAAASYPNTAVKACGGVQNVAVVSASTGKKVTEGCVPGMGDGWRGNVTVADIGGPRGTVTQRQVYENSSHFNVRSLLTSDLSFFY